MSFRGPVSDCEYEAPDPATPEGFALASKRPWQSNSGGPFGLWLNQDAWAYVHAAFTAEIGRLSSRIDAIKHAGAPPAEDLHPS